MNHDSPLRYPGGKARLAGLLTDLLALNELETCEYFEPFAGGAGAALALLGSQAVSRIYLNDADHRIYAFWKSCKSQSDRFAERILKVPVTINEWYRQRSICSAPSQYKQFDVGFAAFFMNRCNRSGVIDGAGPIGGYKQSGKWRLDVRFNRQELAARVLQLGKMQSRISISNLDALDFLKRKLPRGFGRKKVFVYLDPPYVQKGQRLYLNAYDKQDHRALSAYLRSQRWLPWFASYDDAPLIRQLYAPLQVCLLPIQYSLHVKRMACELAIAPQHVLLPALCRKALVPVHQFQKVS
ncbi:MAG: DNA adenine methylase [Burkholderiales bacterium]|nr:DNA adenine methylase [Phycisphaerae bacterium]